MDRVAKAHINVIDTQNICHAESARDSFRAARSLPNPIPCVGPDWLTDSLKFAVVQNTRREVYDPIRQLEEAAQKERQNKKQQQLNDLRQLHTMQRVSGSDPQLALGQQQQRIGQRSKVRYTPRDNYNILEQLLVTRNTHGGLKLAEELAAKYPHHTKHSYQSYLRDNYENNVNFRAKLHQYRETGINPIKFPAALKVADRHIGEDVASVRPAIGRQEVPSHPRRDKVDNGEESFEDDNEPRGETNGAKEGSIQFQNGAIVEADCKGEEPIAASSTQSAKDEAPARMRPSRLPPMPGYRPHGTVNHLNEDYEESVRQQEERLAQVREESRPPDDSTKHKSLQMSQMSLPNASLQADSFCGQRPFTKNEKQFVLDLLVAHLNEKNIEDPAMLSPHIRKELWKSLSQDWDDGLIDATLRAKLSENTGRILRSFDEVATHIAGNIAKYFEAGMTKWMWLRDDRPNDADARHADDVNGDCSAATKQTPVEENSSKSSALSIASSVNGINGNTGREEGDPLAPLQSSPTNLRSSEAAVKASPNKSHSQTALSGSPTDRNDAGAKEVTGQAKMALRSVEVLYEDLETPKLSNTPSAVGGNDTLHDDVSSRLVQSQFIVIQATAASSAPNSHRGNESMVDAALPRGQQITGAVADTFNAHDAVVNEEVRAETHETTKRRIRSSSVEVDPQQLHRNLHQKKYGFKYPFGPRDARSREALCNHQLGENKGTLNANDSRQDGSSTNVAISGRANHRQRASDLHKSSTSSASTALAQRPSPQVGLQRPVISSDGAHVAVDTPSPGFISGRTRATSPPSHGVSPAMTTAGQNNRDHASMVNFGSFSNVAEPRRQWSEGRCISAPANGSIVAAVPTDGNDEGDFGSTTSAPQAEASFAGRSQHEGLRDRAPSHSSNLGPATSRRVKEEGNPQYRLSSRAGTVIQHTSERRMPFDSDDRRRPTSAQCNVSRSAVEKSTIDLELAKTQYRLALLQLCKRFGFTTLSQLRPFLDARGSLKKTSARLQRHFDGLASEYGWTRESIIALVRECDGKLLRVQKRLDEEEIEQDYVVESQRHIDSVGHLPAGRTVSGRGSETPPEVRRPSGARGYALDGPVSIDRRRRSAQRPLEDRTKGHVRPPSTHETSFREMRPANFGQELVKEEETSDTDLPPSPPRDRTEGRRAAGKIVDSHHHRDHYPDSDYWNDDDNIFDDDERNKAPVDGGIVEEEEERGQDGESEDCFDDEDRYTGREDWRRLPLRLHPPRQEERRRARGLIQAPGGGDVSRRGASIATLSSSNKRRREEALLSSGPSTTRREYLFERDSTVRHRTPALKLRKRIIRDEAADNFDDDFFDDFWARSPKRLRHRV